MNNNFEPGDLIFLIDRIGFVCLAKYKSNYGSKSVEAVDIETNNCYWGYGFAATPENREALVTLYSEDDVPRLPLRGSELTKELLKQQKYVLCLVSHISDDDARSTNPPIVRTVVEADGRWFESVAGSVYMYAVPIDNHGHEITEIE